MEKLEKIVNELEKGDLDLDTSVSKFEEGMKLLKNSISIKTDKMTNSLDKIRAIVLIQIKILLILKFWRQIKIIAKYEIR